MAPKRENITLVLAIVGAVTGLISFSINVQDQIKYRPRVEMDFKIVDVARSQPRPQIVAVLIYKNLGKSRINLVKTPEVMVLHPDGKKFGPFTMLPPKLDVAQMLISLEPLGVKDQGYVVPELEEAIVGGQLADIRSHPTKFKFEVRIKTTEGDFHQTFAGIELANLTAGP